VQRIPLRKIDDLPKEQPKNDNDVHYLMPIPPTEKKKTENKEGDTLSMRSLS